MVQRTISCFCDVAYETSSVLQRRRRNDVGAAAMCFCNIGGVAMRDARERHNVGGARYLASATTVMLLRLEESMVLGRVPTWAVLECMVLRSVVTWRVLQCMVLRLAL